MAAKETNEARQAAAHDPSAPVAGAALASRRQRAWVADPALEETTGHAVARASLVAGVLMVAAALFWASTAEIVESAVATGEIQPAGGIRKVRHAEGGRIAELLVEEGDHVVRGQTVVRLDGTRAQAMLARLRARRESLLSQDQRAFASTELLELDQEIARLEHQLGGLDVVSPIDGVIHHLPVGGAGEAVPPAAVVAEIVPAGGPLIVRARLSPRDIGTIENDQPVEVRVDAYDHARFGTVPGRITHISLHTYEDRSGRPYFEARIALERNHVEGAGRRHELVPGMTTEAEIVTGRKTLLRTLLRPVYAIRERAFKEP